MDSSRYHRFVSECKGVNRNFNTIQDMINYRPVFNNDGNVFQLYKHDIQIQNNGSLKIINPKVCNKNGFVLFSYHTHHVGWSQDTKSMFTALVILLEGDTKKELYSGCDNTMKLLKTCKTPMLMFLNKDGSLGEFQGPVNVDALMEYVNRSRFM